MVGFMRNKIVAGTSRRYIYLSGLITSLIASLTVYLITCLFTFVIGSLLFQSNVSIPCSLFICIRCIDGVLIVLFTIL